MTKIIGAELLTIDRESLFLHSDRVVVLAGLKERLTLQNQLVGALHLLLPV